MSLLNRAKGVVCSSPEFAQTWPQNMKPSLMTTMVLGNNRISKMKNGSFSGLNLLGKPLWSTTLAMLKPKVDVNVHGLTAA